MSVIGPILCVIFLIITAWADKGFKTNRDEPGGDT